jgi:hypothetical protein
MRTPTASPGEVACEAITAGEASPKYSSRALPAFSAPQKAPLRKSTKCGPNSSNYRDLTPHPLAARPVSIAIHSIKTIIISYTIPRSGLLERSAVIETDRFQKSPFTRPICDTAPRSLAHSVRFRRYTFSQRPGDFLVPQISPFLPDDRSVAPTKTIGFPVNTPTSHRRLQQSF